MYTNSNRTVVYSLKQREKKCLRSVKVRILHLQCHFKEHMYINGTETLHTNIDIWAGYGFKTPYIISQYHNRIFD